MTSLIRAGGTQRNLVLRSWPATARLERELQIMAKEKFGAPPSGGMKKSRRDSTRIRVFADEHERALIQAGADATGLSVSAYLRNVGVGYPVRSIVDLRQVAELAKINADLGRLGGLLKLWLAGDPRLDPVRFPHIERTIVATLTRIETTQDEMRGIMDEIIKS